MTVATFTLPNFPTQDPATYKANIDAGFAVSKRLLDAFAPHAQATPDMTVAIDAGFSFYGGSLTEVAAQNTAAIAASSRAGITRIDRVVVDQVTGVYSLVAGTSVAASIPSGKMPVAQVALTTASTAITNSMLTDERAFPSTPAAANFQSFTSTGAFTWSKPTGYSTNSRVVVMAWAGGGGGGNAGGGGGGAGLSVDFKLSDLSTSETVTVGNGGAGTGASGNNTSFGSHLTVYGGVGGSGNIGGGGGGIFAQGSGTTGGAPIGGSASSTSNFGGGGGGNAGANAGGASVYGGGGGGGGSTSGAGAAGGRSFMGGGGGGGGSVGAAQAGGASVLGGAGGNGSTLSGGAGTVGAQPGGGGGNLAAGGDGQVLVWVFP